MSRIKLGALALVVIVLLLPSQLSARGLRGGGGGGGGSRMAGGGGGGGGMSRPAPRPSVPNLGSSRPAPASRPNISSPNMNRPSTRPARPSPPKIDRPSGGLKPSTRPATPSLPGSGSNAGNKLPNVANRPSTLPGPGIPNLGGSLENRPGNKLPNRPQGGRPVTLPGNTGNRPNQNLPGNAATRPSPGDLGDFLGMGRPLTPEPLPGVTRPGIDTRPGFSNRPGIDTRPGVPGQPANRFPNRPGAIETPRFPGVGIGNNQPINIGNINIGNNVAISNRPTWANIDRNQITNINNRWQNQIGGLHNWNSIHPNRAAYWAGWGAGVHSAYHWHYQNPGCFRGSWWYGHPHSWCGWHYGYGFYNRPWKYWWTVPTYAACVNWFTWSAPQQVWAQPVYYDYGQGGNVVYNDNSVYINGNQVATTTEFAQSAADLATVPAPANEEEAKKAEWMPLGTFAVSAAEKDVEPTRIVQLAVSKEGIVSGTLYNTETDVTQSVQGKVDKDTQRVAMRIGESEDIVIETGLYNLTQQEAPVLVHFGAEKVENWLLVRLEDPAPEDDSEPTAQP